MRPRKSDAIRVDPEIPEGIRGSAAWIRLEHQLHWYDSKSLNAQARYKQLRIAQVALAVAIPLIAPVTGTVVVRGISLMPGPWLTGMAGAAIALLEGIQALQQYGVLWITYRSTAERLKHEKYLFLSGAGPYRGLSSHDASLLLAERVEEHVSSEHANWFNETRRSVADRKTEQK